jgi:hypothetical protein
MISGLVGMCELNIWHVTFTNLFVASNVKSRLDSDVMNAQGRKRRPCRFLRDLIECLEEACHERDREHIHVIFSIGPLGDRLRIKAKGGEKDKMKVTLTDIQGFNVAVAFQDSRGNPATVIAAPVWAASDENLLTVTPSDDGLSATVVAKGPLGVGQVTLNADGGPNAGDDPIVGVLDVEVVSSKATQAVFSPAPATDQP